MRAILQTLGALCLLPMTIIPAAILGCVSRILSIDEGSAMIAFYISNAAILAPLMLCGAIMCAASSFMRGE